MWVSAGIDFGNKNIVLAIPRNGGVDVIPNSAGSRLTPSVVCYTGDRRYFGDAAVQQETMYLDSTIQQLKRLISVPYDSKEREEIQSIVSFNLVPNTDGTTGVGIEFHGEKMVIRPEQCIAYLLKNIDKMARNAQSSISEYVIAVSPWWPERQRYAILNACKIAKLNCMALVNSTTAAAIAYTKIHAQRLPEDNPVPVAFIDFGNSSMNVAIAMVKQGSVAIKSFTYDDKLGGSHFTVELIKYLLQKVQQTYKIDPTTNRRAMIQFRNHAEKLKKTLSINAQVQFEIPNLMNDIDVKFVVKREEFNEQIKDLISKVTIPIDAALQKANINKEDLFDIEFLGGGSRVPAVKDKIAEFFGKDPKCSLNLDECFAYGSAYMAAYLNPSTRVNLTVKDVSPYSVEAEWNEEEPQKKELFEQFSEVPSTTTLQLRVQNTSDVTITSNNDVICVATIETGVDDIVEVKLNIKLTQSSTIEVTTASFKFEDKEKAAKVTVTQKEGMNDEEIEKLRKIEEMFEASDLAEEKLDNTKNALQSSYFTLLNTLRDDGQYINDEQLKEAQEKVNEVMNWYDENEFEKLPIDEYEKRMKEVDELSKPILHRIKMLKNAKDDLLPKLTNRVEAILKSTGNQQDEGYTKINQEATQTKDEISNILSNMKNLPNDFDVNEIAKKVAFIEGQLKAQKQQNDWRAQQRKNEEELIRKRKQANEEEEMRKRILEQQMKRRQLENEEEEEQVDPFSFLFGQPMQRRQKLRRKQYDQEEAERKQREEIERQREAQREAERRAELQRRAEEQKRLQLAAEQRRRKREPWGFQDDNDDQSSSSSYFYNDDEDNDDNPFNFWNPYAQRRTRRQPQRRQARQQQQQYQEDEEQQSNEQQLREQQFREQQRQQQLREQQLREQQLREKQLREQQIREQQQREQQIREQQLREQMLREQQREQQLREQQYRKEQLREQQREQELREQQREYQLREQQQRKQREQQLRQQRLRQQAIDDAWGDPLAWGDPTPRPQARRRVVQQQPQRRVEDIWGNPWGNSGWRDPFF